VRLGVLFLDISGFLIFILEKQIAEAEDPDPTMNFACPLKGAASGSIDQIIFLEDARQG